jgi:hypothetical protein
MKSTPSMCVLRCHTPMSPDLQNSACPDLQNSNPDLQPDSLLTCNLIHSADLQNSGLFARNNRHLRASFAGPPSFSVKSIASLAFLRVILPLSSCMDKSLSRHCASQRCRIAIARSCYSAASVSRCVLALLYPCRSIAPRSLRIGIGINGLDSKSARIKIKPNGLDQEKNKMQTTRTCSQLTEQELQHIRSIPCPDCHAAANQFCMRITNRKPMPIYLHAIRCWCFEQGIKT